MPVLFNLLHVIPTQGTKCKMNLSRESHVKVGMRGKTWICCFLGGYVIREVQKNTH